MLRLINLCVCLGPLICNSVLESNSNTTTLIWELLNFLLACEFKFLHQLIMLLLMYWCPSRQVAQSRLKGCVCGCCCVELAFQPLWKITKQIYYEMYTYLSLHFLLSLATLLFSSPVISFLLFFFNLSLEVSRPHVKWSGSWTTFASKQPWHCNARCKC